jgi:hypothetical protein
MEKTKSFAELKVIKIDKDSDNLIIEFNNTLSDTIGIFSMGIIREVTDNVDLSKAFNNVILEIKQNDKLVKSSEIKFYWILFDHEWGLFDHEFPEIRIINPHSKYTLSLAYASNLREDFNLSSSKFEIRAIIESSIDLIKIAMGESEYMEFKRKHPNVKIIEDIITTPFVRVK